MAITQLSLKKKNKDFDWFFGEKKGLYFMSNVLDISFSYIPDVGLSLGRIFWEGKVSSFYLNIFDLIKLGQEPEENHWVDEVTYSFGVVWKKPKNFSYTESLIEYRNSGLYIWCHPFYFAMGAGTNLVSSSIHNLGNKLPFAGVRRIR